VALFQINQHPGDKELRWFAGLWFPLLGAVAGWTLFHKLHQPRLAILVWIGATAICGSGLVAPRSIGGVYRWSLRLTYPIGWVMSHAILAAAYYVVITPVGRLVRLFHDPMQRRFDHERQSYWIPREQPERSRYFRQT